MPLRFIGAIAAGLAATVSIAHATTMTMTGNYTAVDSVTGTYAPTINDDGGSFLPSPFTTGSLTVGVTTTPTTFLQIQPATVNGSTATEMGAIDVVLTLLGPNGSAVTGVQTSAGGNPATLSHGSITFAANYELFYQTQTDCLVWNSTTCTPNNNTSTIGETLTVDFADGAVLAVNLYNWSDWDMSPEISFELISGGPTSVPEPGTLAIFASAIAGLAAMRRRVGDWRRG